MMSKITIRSDKEEAYAIQSRTCWILGPKTNGLPEAERQQSLQF